MSLLPRLGEGTLDIGPKKGNVSCPAPQSARSPSSAPTGLSAQCPPPQSPASKQPAAEGLNPGGLTLPGEADAIQPGLLEAQMGRVSAPLQPGPDPLQRQP